MCVNAETASPKRRRHLMRAAVERQGRKLPTKSQSSRVIQTIAGAALVVLFGCRGAFAEPCVITNRQIYNLVADTVNWS
jgi:hypothetical protein